MFCTLVKTSFRGLYKGFHWLVIVVGTGADREVLPLCLFSRVLTLIKLFRTRILVTNAFRRGFAHCFDAPSLSSCNYPKGTTSLHKCRPALVQGKYSCDILLVVTTSRFEKESMRTEVIVDPGGAPLEREGKETMTNTRVWNGG